MTRGKRKGPNRAVSPAVELLFNSGQATGGRDCQRHWGSLRNPNPPSVFHFPACCLLETFTFFFHYSLFNWFWPQTFPSKDCALLPPAAAPARRSQHCFKSEADHYNRLWPKEILRPMWCLRCVCPRSTQGVIQVHRDLRPDQKPTEFPGWFGWISSKTVTKHGSQCMAPALLAFNTSSSGTRKRVKIPALGIMHVPILKTCKTGESHGMVLFWSGVRSLHANTQQLFLAQIHVCCWWGGTYRRLFPKAFYFPAHVTHALHSRARKAQKKQWWL